MKSRYMDRINQIKYAVDQLIVKGNLDIVDSVFSKNYAVHTGSKSYNGHTFIKQFTKQLRAAIPNIKIVNIEFLSQTDNIITWQRTYSGTHKTDLKGIPASGKKVKWYEIVVSRFDKDKIIEEWVVTDLACQLMLKLK